MAKHALLPVEKFDATELVGKADSFFGAMNVTSGAKRRKKDDDK
jgi:hypothetical protein